MLTTVWQAVSISVDEKLTHYSFQSLNVIVYSMDVKIYDSMDKQFIAHKRYPRWQPHGPWQGLPNWIFPQYFLWHSYSLTLTWLSIDFTTRGHLAKLYWSGGIQKHHLSQSSICCSIALCSYIISQACGRQPRSSWFQNQGNCIQSQKTIAPFHCCQLSQSVQDSPVYPYIASTGYIYPTGTVYFHREHVTTLQLNWVR